MTPTDFATATAWSYGLAVAGYAAFAVRVSVGLRRSVRAALLLAALVATAIWAALCIPLAFDPPRLALAGEETANALRYGVWFVFIGHLLVRPNLAAPGRPLPRNIVVIVAAWLVACVVLGNGLPVSRSFGLGARIGFALPLGTAVFGLIFVEHIMYRVEPQYRWGIKPLALALGGAFGFDLFLYADALLFGYLDPDIYIARGFANFIVVPLIAVATARNTGWTVDLHISRKAVISSTALLASGAFLLAIAGAGYLVRYVGGDWTRALEIELAFVAVLFAALVAASGTFRSRLKVFVSKHFFSYRYDYREEWLRFTRTLASQTAAHGVQENTIIALAGLVESPAGTLWLRNESSSFMQTARWNAPAQDAAERSDGPLAAFLERTGWIVSVNEVRANPDRYRGLTLPAWFDAFPEPWLIVPLPSSGKLLGFVVLAASRTPIDVDWEVRDLLKTASRQAASFLGEIQATEALLEARKFDAFNRMSAFVVHDLKNLIAQLSLMLSNAERHRDNRAFQTDMLATVEHAVERMNALMRQLRTGAEPVESPRLIDIGQLVQRVCAARREPKIDIRFEGESGVALGHEDRLEHVIGHLLQNAIDASPSSGHIDVRVAPEDGSIVIQVADDGVGMSREFVRERLFKPFQTTKPTGMGIGVYESAQYVARLGGDIQIESAEGGGTRVRVRLPQIEPGGGDAQPALKEHAA